MGNDPTGPKSGEFRIFRGGSYWNVADDCTATSGASNDPWTKNPTIGFRVFRTVPEIKAQGRVERIRLSTETQPEMTDTPVPVPKRWLDPYLAEYGGETKDYEVAANATGANGLKLWESCVAGLNPTDPNSVLRATIAMNAEGEPEISWTPKDDLLPGTYKILGSGTLDGPWLEVTEANKPDFRFFKVRIDME